MGYIGKIDAMNESNYSVNLDSLLNTRQAIIKLAAETEAKAGEIKRLANAYSP